MNKKKNFIRFSTLCLLVCLLVMNTSVVVFAASDDLIWNGGTVSFQTHYSSYDSVLAYGTNNPGGQGSQSAILLFTKTDDNTTYHLTITCNGVWQNVNRPLPIGTYNVTLASYTGTGTPYIMVNFIKN